ncbi:DUF257 family protein [Thermococcus sp.]
MDVSLFERYLLGKAAQGDTVLIEYSSLYPVETVAWGEVIPLLIRSGGLVVCDFFGIGDMLFRKHLRRLPGKKYSEFVELIKDVRVIKVGPGAGTYGETIDELVPTYDPHTFLRNYHAVMSKISRLPEKPKFFITFGLGHYVHFNPDDALKSILTGVGNIPMEDLISVHFVNGDILKSTNLAILEEIATFVMKLSRSGLIVLKESDEV